MSTLVLVPVFLSDIYYTVLDTEMELFLGKSLILKNGNFFCQ